MKEAEEFYPKTQDEWRAWLQKNHKQKDAVWLVFYKKSSAKFNQSWSDAVDQALCFGWIDSTKQRIDDERFRQYFCKRKPKSNWSKINKDKIEKITAQNLMAEAGLQSVAVAKQNGSWTVLDAIERLEIPEDLAQALQNEPGALAFFSGLRTWAKKGMLYWVASAKRPETRQKRIAEIVTSASQNTKPKRFL